MNLDNVPNVLVPFPCGRKFVVAKLTDHWGKEKVIVRVAHDKQQYYCDLVVAVLRDLLCWAPAFIGGGRMQVDYSAKLVCVWGDAEEYGRESNRNKTIEMLQSVFKFLGFRVESID